METSSTLTHVLTPKANWTRFNVYYVAARDFFEGDSYNPNELATMMHDLLWDEIPSAFAVALARAVRTGPLRDNIGASFRRLVRLSLFKALGEVASDVVPYYLRRNWEFFFVSMIEQLLRSNATVEIDGEAELRRAFRAVLEMIKGVCEYTSFARTAEFSGTHALLHISSIGRPNFLEHGAVGMNVSLSATSKCVSVTRAHIVLMDVVGEQILAEPLRDVKTWNHAFGFYAGCGRWRGLAARCLSEWPRNTTCTYMMQLERAVSGACVTLRNPEIPSVSTPPGTKQKQSADDDDAGTGTWTGTGKGTGTRPCTPPLRAPATSRKSYVTPERAAAPAKRVKPSPPFL